MERILILNASPRAPKSNSRKYAEIFRTYCNIPTQYAALTHDNFDAVYSQITDFSHLLLVFPLYADGIPSTLMRFFDMLEKRIPRQKPTVSVLINCGFLEPSQNNIAVQMVRLFCTQNGYPFGAVLKIGSGEAILDSPFRFLAKRKIRRLASAICHGQTRVLQVTMPLSKAMFIKASTRYWKQYGARNGVTYTQMQTLQIE